MTDLLHQAMQLAQEGVEIFPVGKDKRPLIKGWRAKATTDPDTIKGWFGPGGSGQGIGVPCGPEQDLICFDLDYGHTDSAERKSKLNAWLDTWLWGDFMVRETRSGGLHVITAWPDDVARVPRRLMPKLDVIIEGFYFVWNTSANDYKHSAGPTDLADIARATAGMCEVVERDTHGTGAGLMTADEAHDVMWSDGDGGQRHDALLRMTQDWVDNNPEMSPTELCETFSAWFSDVYENRIEPGRLDQLLEWREDRGELSGELGRAFAGAQQPVERAMDNFAAALSSKPDRVKLSDRLSAAGRGEKISTAEDKAEAALPTMSDDDWTRLVVDEVLQRELEDIDWIVDGFLPAHGLVGLAGPSGAGKTRFVSALLAALSSGQTDKIGLPAADRPVRTLYIANEERSSDIERRVKAAAIASDISGSLEFWVRGKDHSNLYLMTPEGPHEENINAIISKAAKVRAELVIFDPFVTLGTEDENSAAHAGAVIDQMKLISAAAKVCCMFIHHTPKGDRSAPSDDLRGDAGAFRGSGVIYSSLDVGVTLMPYLPPACHAGREAKENRRKLAQAVRDQKLAKYIVLDGAKDREHAGNPPAYFRLESRAVREGGAGIGAVVRVDEMTARLDCESVLEEAISDIEAVNAVRWARVFVDEWPDDGEHKVTISELVSALDAADPTGWQTSDPNEEMRANRGKGKLIVDAFEGGVKAGNVIVRVEVRGRRTVLVMTRL